MLQSVFQGSGLVRELRQSYFVFRRRKQCFICWDFFIIILRGRIFCGEVFLGCILGIDRFQFFCRVVEIFVMDVFFLIFRELLFIWLGVELVVIGFVSGVGIRQYLEFCFFGAYIEFQDFVSQFIWILRMINIEGREVCCYCFVLVFGVSVRVCLVFFFIRLWIQQFGRLFIAVLEIVLIVRLGFLVIVLVYVGIQKLQGADCGRYLNILCFRCFRVIYGLCGVYCVR